MKLLKISLASSAELKPDREQFEIFINRRNAVLVKQGYFIELVIWENFLDALSPIGLQNEYNRAIQTCDVFVMLYHTKVGKFSRSEFETALEAFRKHGRPLIYTFYKKPAVAPGESAPMPPSVQEFRAQLDDLGHFATGYQNTQDLLLKFGEQLERLIAGNLIGHGNELPVHASTAAAPQPGYKIGPIIQLIDRIFSAEEFEIFVLSHFEELRRQFTPGMQQLTRIQLLVTHARNRGKLPILLSQLQATAPEQYLDMGPYESS